jgi:dynein heavy chain 2
MEELKRQAAEEDKVLQTRKKAIDKELAEVEPLVQAAKAAVGNIKTESLSEIRSLRAPPDTIRDILEGVLRLMGIFDTSWVSMKRYALLPLYSSNKQIQLWYSTVSFDVCVCSSV